MVQEQIPVKMAVFNNGYLGMVRQWQQFFHGRRYSATPIWSPDFVKLADAYGIAGYRVEDAGQIEDVVARASAEPGPTLVEFLIEQEANVFPMVPPGGSLSESIEGEPAAAAEVGIVIPIDDGVRGGRGDDPPRPGAGRGAPPEPPGRPRSP